MKRSQSSRPPSIISADSTSTVLERDQCRRHQVALRKVNQSESSSVARSGSSGTASGSSGSTALPGTTTPYGQTTYGVESGDWLAFDFTYLFRVTEDLRLTATIQNLTDEDPPESRQELGYDPRMGSPLGRTFEIGVKKTF